MPYKNIYDDKEIFALKNKCKLVQQSIHRVVQSIPVGSTKKIESSSSVGSINNQENFSGVEKVEEEGFYVEKNSKNC